MKTKKYKPRAKKNFYMDYQLQQVNSYYQTGTDSNYNMQRQ